jgi:integrase
MRVKHRSGTLTRQFSAILPPYDDAQPSRDVAFSGVAAFTSRSDASWPPAGIRKPAVADLIPRLQWPKPVFKAKRAITTEEHAAIVLREQNTERRDFYELLWHTGAAQSDGACLLAEDINWEARTICFTRKKLKSRGTSIKPTLFRFSADIAAVLKRRPAVGPLFPYLCTVRAGDRATEFKQRCDGLGISGVSLHSYRYAWAERALKCGFPERFAQQALGHNSKAVHRAYAKHAEVTVPSLDDWEKDWHENPQRSVQPKLLPVGFRLLMLPTAQAN